MPGGERHVQRFRRHRRGVLVGAARHQRRVPGGEQRRGHRRDSARRQRPRPRSPAHPGRQHQRHRRRRGPEAQRSQAAVQPPCGNQHEAGGQRPGNGANRVHRVDEAQVGAERLIAARARLDRQREGAAEGERQRQQPRTHEQHLTPQHRVERGLGLGHGLGHGAQAAVDREGRDGHRDYGRRQHRGEPGRGLGGAVGEAPAHEGAQGQTGDEDGDDETEGVGGGAQNLREQARPYDLERQGQEA